MHVHHKEVSEMTDEEKSFYYFKIHDTDNNDYLDGLEMIKAAIHRHGNFELQDELSHVTSKFKSGWQEYRCVQRLQNIRNFGQLN